MKLATLRSGPRDGALVAVSRDSKRFLKAPEPFGTLQSALENWTAAAAVLKAAEIALEAGEGTPLADHVLAAPLPRAWQWLDGSAFTNHGDLMQRLFGGPPHAWDIPLMYQGMSHMFLGPNDDVPFVDEKGGIDFEGEFGVIVDEVPMGVSAREAMGHIKLLVQINDWSLRNLAGREMKTGFGWIQAKPACSMAPFAVTPDEIGKYWRDGRVHLDLRVEVNGQGFGSPNGGEMGFSFPELVAHAAATRQLCAGTVIGSGTVSNKAYLQVGSTCIAERRAIETLDAGEPSTPFLAFGDRVRMEAGVPGGGPSPFGALDQRVAPLASRS
jgi:fumarylacetoacetate (FAA) hydrolase